MKHPGLSGPYVVDMEAPYLGQGEIMDTYFDPKEFWTYEYRFFCAENSIPCSDIWLGSFDEVKQTLGPKMFAEFRTQRPWAKEEIH